MKANGMSQIEKQLREIGYNSRIEYKNYLRAISKDSFIRSDIERYGKIILLIDKINAE